MPKTKENKKTKVAETPVEPKEEVRPSVPNAKATEVIEAKYEPEKDGYKVPSIANMRRVHTKKDFEELIERYKVQNPAKYEQKKVALEQKLKNLK